MSVAGESPQRKSEEERFATFRTFQTPRCEPLPTGASLLIFAFPTDVGEKVRRVVLQLSGPRTTEGMERKGKKEGNALRHVASVNHLVFSGAIRLSCGGSRHFAESTLDASWSP